MPTVCRYVPNRSAPRHFTERDLQRIAQTMVKQGHPVRNIIATILIATGFGFLVCRLASAIENSLGIMRILKEIALVVASAGAINAIIIWLSRIKAVPIPVVTNIIGWLLVLFLAIRALAKGAAGLASDLETIEDMSSIVKDWCDAITEKIPDIGG
jgi:hypothetical protein